MTLTLPIDVFAVLTALTQAGHQAYIVGGAVRDLLLNIEPTDWDFTTDARPEEILKIFTDSFYENDFGTVAIARKHVSDQFGLPLLESSISTDPAHYSQVIDLDQATKIHQSLTGKRASGGDKNLNHNNLASANSDQDPTSKHKSVFEITTFRSDGSYSDFRRPDSVKWGDSIQEDLRRRDFTINAMAIEINQDFLNNNLQPQNSATDQTISLSADACNLIDPHHGQSDLEKKRLVTVGEAGERFREDALRMLRAIRFSVQLDYALDDSIIAAIVTHAPLLAHISHERRSEEFMKMLASDSPRTAIELLDQLNLLEHILPELILAKEVAQSGHHTTDVWTHSLDALHHCPSKDPIVRLATLIHDIAKPATRRVSGKSITFYNHEVVGARMAKQIAIRLKLSRKDCERVFTLVRHHMFYYQSDNTDAAIRRFMRKVGLENINDIIDLRIGDRLGSGSRETSWRLEEMKLRMQEQLHQPFSVHDLAISGNDLISECGMTPGPQMGKILQMLFEEVMEEPGKNNREYLLDQAKQLIG